MSEEWETAKLPALYSKAKKALAECVKVDECKAWKVQANMIASYARQYNDKSLLEDCYEIRNRAGRRMGELLTKTPSRQGARTDLVRPVSPSRGTVARDAGLSDYERNNAMRLAAMPKQEFEQRVREPALGQQKGKVLPPGTVRCPHCGGVIVL